MQPDERDAAFLWDMLEAARLVNEYVQNVEVVEYLADRKLQLAIERLVEIIGEAARGVSRAFKASHPEIPWRGIIAQRNVVAHDYGEILQERMRNLAVDRIPELISQLEDLLPPKLD